GSRPDRSSRAFEGLGRAFPPALPTLARVRLQRLSPIGNRRNPPPRAENAANFFRSSTRAAICGELAVITFGPHMMPGDGINELRGDTHPVRCLANAAFQR